MQKVCYTDPSSGLPSKALRETSSKEVFRDRKIENEGTVRPIKIVVEKHTDGYVAYPLGLRGVIIGEGDSYEEALGDVRSAIRFHLETFGPDAFDTDSPVLEAFVAEAGIAVK